MERARRRWWTRLLTLGAALVVIAASVSSLFRLAMDAVPGYRQTLEQRVAQQIGMPLHVGALRLVWHGLDPGLALDDVQLRDQQGQPTLRVGRVRLDLALTPLLSGRLAARRVVASDLTLHVAVDAAGRWTLSGQDGAGGDWRRRLREVLDRFGELRLQHCAVVLDDARLAQRPLTFALTATLSHRGDRYRLQAGARPPPGIASDAAVDLQLRGDPLQPQTLYGHVTAALTGLRSLPWLDRELPGATTLAFDGGHIELSGAIQHGRLQQMQAQLGVPTLVALRSQRVAARAVALDGTLLWQRQQQGWQLTTPGLTLQDLGRRWTLHGALTRTLNAAGDAHWQAQADTVQLQDITPWLALWPRAASALAALPQLHGALRQWAVDVGAAPAAGTTDPRRYTLHGDLVDVGWGPQDGRPGVDHLSAHVLADQNGGQLQLASSPPTLLDPAHFAVPLRFDALSGTLQWQRVAQGWTLQVPQLDWRLAGSQGRGRLAYQLSTADPTGGDVDAALRFNAADVTALKPLIPLSWGKGLRDWLQHALVAGAVSSGSLDLHGPLHGFPYTAADSKGRWALDLDVDHATLAYAPGWPSADHVEAQLQFRGNGLRIVGRHARADGLRLSPVTATFADFNDHLLTVQLGADADISRFYTLLRDSPLRTRLAGLVDHSRASGPAQVSLQLQVPLQQPDQSRVDGAVQLQGVTLRYHGLSEPLTALQGRVAFNNQGARASDLQARLAGTALQAAIAPADGAPAGLLRVRFDVDPDDRGGVAAAFLPRWLRAQLHGTSQWLAALPLDGPAAGVLTLSSDLQGTAIALPAPLAKPATASWPLSVTLRGDADAPLYIEVDGGSHFAAALRFATAAADKASLATPSTPPTPPTPLPSSAGATADPASATATPTLQAMTLRLGGGAPPTAKVRGLRVVGAPAELDLGALFDLLAQAPWAATTADAAADVPTAASADATSLPFLGADVAPALLRLGELRLQPTHVVVSPAGDELRIALDGRGAAGEVTWRRAPHTVRATFSHLALRPLPATPAAAATVGASKPATAAPLDPGALPTLDLDCAALSVDDHAFGHLQVQTTRSAAGQTLQTLKLSGAGVDLQASGAWQRDAGGSGSTAQLGFRLDVDKLADALGALGFARNVGAQHAEFSGSLSWPAATAGVDLAQAQGQVSIGLRNGLLKVVKPGAGRVLGLLNIYALPRRLLFNFRDVVDKGLAFDTVNGHFALGQGQAVTRDLDIVGPSVRMDVRGRIGLAARDFDEVVTVYPDISTGVTLGAALLGGPLAGGIALLAQQLVGKALDTLTRLSYRVTGSWDNPQVVRVGGSRADAVANRAERAAEPAGAPHAGAGTASTTMPSTAASTQGAQ